MLTHLCANCGPHAACERNEWLQNRHHRRVEHQKLRQSNAWEHGSCTYNFSFLSSAYGCQSLCPKQPHPFFRWSKILFLYNAASIYITNDSLTMLWPSGRFRKKLCWLFASFFRGTWSTSLCCVFICFAVPAQDACHNIPPTILSRILVFYVCFLISCLFCFVNFAFCPAEMRVLLISQLKAFFPALEVQR